MSGNPEQSLARQEAHQKAKKWGGPEHYFDRQGRAWVVYHSGGEHLATGVWTPEFRAAQAEVRGRERDAVLAELIRVLRAYAAPDLELGWAGWPVELVENAEEVAAFITEHADLDIEPRYPL